MDISIDRTRIVVDMKHILGVEGEAALQALLDTRALLAFDFDGTLAPIVADPRMARTPLPAARALRTLGQWWPIAVVTGRAVADMSERLGFEPMAVVGSHGAEDPTLPENVDPARLDIVRLALESGGTQTLRDAGVQVEDKGHSMALHYRLARDRERARLAALDFVRGLGDAVGIFEGKMVVNIVLPDSPHKGDAVLSLARRIGAESVLFVGDDINDEPVFRVAAPNWVTIKVGRDPHSAARFFLDSAAEMAVLLDLCVKLSSKPA